MRGGKRLGAGRKPALHKKRMVSFRLHPKLIERLKMENNQASAIEKALCQWFNIDLQQGDNEQL